MKIAGRLHIAMCIAVLAAPLPAAAAEMGGCESFAWPIATELQWMKASGDEAVASGAKIETLPGKAIALSLVPMDKISFPVAPTSRRKNNDASRYGGIVEFEGVSEPGVYQISLPTTGWIDVVQNGKALKSLAHTGKSDCDGIRKSVRFRLDPGPFSIEISGIAKDSIKFAIRRGE
jgi:hypothetical protein